MRYPSARLPSRPFSFTYLPRSQARALSISLMHFRSCPGWFNRPGRQWDEGSPSRVSSLPISHFWRQLRDNNIRKTAEFPFTVEGARERW
jgi:hypothetical protein